MADNNSTPDGVLWDLGKPVKRCTGCRKVKPLEEFSVIRPRKKKRAYRHPYCDACRRRKACDYAKHQRATNPEYVKRKQAFRWKWHLQKSYGLSLSDYERMVEGQKGLCAICQEDKGWTDSRSGKRRALAIDHNHATGRVRGLLCDSCNVMLANAKDRIEVLRAAITYLEKYR